MRAGVKHDVLQMESVRLDGRRVRRRYSRRISASGGAVDSAFRCDFNRRRPCPDMLGGVCMKIVVIKSPRLLAGVLRGIFHMKRAETVG